MRVTNQKLWYPMMSKKIGTNESENNAKQTP